MESVGGAKSAANQFDWRLEEWLITAIHRQMIRTNGHQRPGRSQINEKGVNCSAAKWPKSSLAHYVLVEQALSKRKVSAERWNLLRERFFVRVVDFGGGRWRRHRQPQGGAVSVDEAAVVAVATEAQIAGRWRHQWRRRRQ